MDDQSEENSAFTPRQYQVELLEKATKKNVIVCLGTGSGKTFIAVMLVKELMDTIKKPFNEGGKRTFFLAKTVPLVGQQARVIRQHTGLKVGHYTGCMNVDAWDIEVWKREFEKNEVFVMTTQILVNILNMAFINLSQINLLIFDECHHAVGGDPIVQVMKNFATCPDSDKPKVMGLTASVLNGKCKPNQIEGKIRKLEVTLNSVVETPTDSVMALLYSTKPEETFICCSDITVYDTLKNGIVTAIKVEKEKLPKIPTEKDFEKFAVNLDDEDSDDDYDDDDDEFDDDDDFKYVMGPIFKLSRLLTDLTFAITELGFWCTSIIAKEMVSELEKIKEDVKEENEIHYLNIKEFISKLSTKFDEYFIACAQGEYDSMMRFSSHKIKRLLETLTKYKPKNVAPNLELLRQREMLGDISSNNPEAMREFDETCPKSDDFKAIIFVERRCSAWVINRFLRQLKENNHDYDFISSEFVMGHGADPAKLKYAQMKSSKQAEKISKFRLKECNVLVATRVVEEGMDIPTCNLVIRFDEPKDFRAYVQSKGRARAAGSRYIMLVKEDDYETLSGNVAMYRNIEDALQKICKERLAPTIKEIESFYDFEIDPFYPRGLNGPVVTMFSAIQLVNRYCSLLPKDKFTRLNVRVKYQKILPKNPPPFNDSDDPDVWDDIDELLSNAVVGQKFEFRCILWLPVNSSLREGIKGEIMRTVKLAKKSVAMKACKLLHEIGELNDDLVPSCKDYEQFTRDLLSVEEEEVPIGSPQPGSLKRRQWYKKQIAPQFETCPQPDTPCHLYLLRVIEKPRESIDTLFNVQTSKNRNFGIITSAALPVIHPFPIYNQQGKQWIEMVTLEKDLVFDAPNLEKIASFHRNFFTKLLGIHAFPMEFDPLTSDMAIFVIPIINVGDDMSPMYFPDWQLIDDINNMEIGHLSDERSRAFQFETSKFEDGVVVPLYLKKKIFYFVKNIMIGINPWHPFPETGKRYKTFIDYFKQKYEITIHKMDQPLISVRMVTDSGFNMLPPRVDKTGKKKTMVINGQVMERETFLVPELCYLLPMTASQFSLGTMMPSIIYRLNDLLLAQQLLETVSSDTQSLDLTCFTHAHWSEVEKTCRDRSVVNESNWVFDFKREFGQEVYTAETQPMPHIILTALTTRAANDSINLERLEFLGDSFLKYAATLYLFSDFSRADEGKLTIGRGELVSNSHLYRLGKREGIANLVKTEIFSPTSHWIPPGFKMIRSSENKLLEAMLPFHAWKYFVGYDVSEMEKGEIWALAIRAINNQSVGDSDGSVHLARDEEVQNLALYQLIADKSVADSVEAILGAYLLYAGPEAALRFLIYLGFKILPVDNNSGMSEIVPYKFPKTALVNPRKSLPNKLLAGLDEFERSIGYEFKDKSFLVQAFTHPSYYSNQSTDCYQRLEFLGDAILDYMITWHLFEDKRRFSPGELTDIRSALVNNITFADLAVEHNFVYYLKQKSPSLFNAINKFLAIVERGNKHFSHQYLYEEDECLDEEQVEVPKALGDLFESVAGAIYLDSNCNLDAVWNVYFRMMEPKIKEYTVNTPKSPIREVYELFPDIVFGKAKRQEPVKSRRDEDEKPKYFVTVKLGAKTFKGVGESAKQAKINAAKLILRFVKRSSKNLKSLGGIDPTSVENKPLTLDEVFEMYEIEEEVEVA